MAVPEDAVAVLAAKFAVMRKVADERTWRVYLGSEARALGHGGIAVVARAAGVPETTVAAGVAEIDAGRLDGLPRGRSRRPGGGRKKAEDAQPGLTGALRGLVDAATRGDPVAEITWCSLSLRDIGRQMAGMGFWCGKDALARMMREDGYSLQGMSRTIEGKQHPDRDARFRRINAMIAEFRAAASWPCRWTRRRRSSSAPITGPAGRGALRGSRCGSATMTSPMRDWGRSPRTGFTTSPSTAGSCPWAPAATPRRSR